MMMNYERADYQVSAYQAELHRAAQAAHLADEVTSTHTHALTVQVGEWLMEMGKRLQAQGQAPQVPASENASPAVLRYSA
jgi:hypothetical protein